MGVQIKDFEEISTLEPEQVARCLKDTTSGTVVKAYMGTSPENAEYLEKIFPEIDFRTEAKAIGRIRIEEIDEAQAAVVSSLY